MRSTQLTKHLLVVTCTTLLVACPGSSDNRSPGSIVVEVPATGGGDGGSGGDNGGSGGDSGGGDGDTIASVIPDDLASVIVVSGPTTPEGKEIYDINESALPGGRLHPAGLILGNGVVFRITGSALRVSQN